MPLVAIVVGRRSACSCSPARRPPRSGLLADISEGFPDDRGAIMGLYCVFLALGQIIGSLIGGVAADWRGPRRHPDRDVRAARDRAGAARPAAPVRALRRRAGISRPASTEGADVTGGPGAGPGPARPGRAAAPSSRPITSRPRRGSSILRAGGAAVDAAIATNAVLARGHADGCGIGGDAFWLVWDAAAGEQVALNGSGRAPAAADAAALRGRGLDTDPAARAAAHHGPGRGPLLGRRARAVRAGCRATQCWPRRSSWPRRASRPGTG